MALSSANGRPIASGLSVIGALAWPLEIAWGSVDSLELDDIVDSLFLMRPCAGSIAEGRRIGCWGRRRGLPAAAERLVQGDERSRYHPVAVSQIVLRLE